LLQSDAVTNERTFNPLLHTLAWLTALTTFPLIFLGGLVTSKAAGMSVPDWPNSWGYNMFLLPLDYWAGNIFYEHAHRLLGSLVGFLAVVLTLCAWGPAASPMRRKIIGFSTLVLLLFTVLLTLTTMQVRPVDTTGSTTLDHVAVVFAGLTLVSFVAWLCRRTEPRRWVRWLCTGALLAVIFQGLLGGLRVVMVKIDLAMVHGCFAQAFFCVSALTIIVTSKWWLRAPDLSQASDQRFGQRMIGFAVACVAVVYGQLIVGAIMRHDQAGLAIPDLPLAYGSVLPPISEQGLAEANRYRIALKDPALLPSQVRMDQVWFHFAHRVGAVVVSTVILLASGYAIWRFRQRSAIFWPSMVLLGLLGVQFTLGLLTVYYRKPADIASAHVATGALVLLTSFVLVTTSMRLYAKRWRPTREVVTIPASTPAQATRNPDKRRLEMSV
jgi:heme a synthase